MAGDALSANLQLANAMGGFAKFLFGAQPTTTSTDESGTTTTKQTTLTQDAVNAMLRQMTEGGLSGNGVPGTGTAGLAAIMSGEKSAGLYNSNVTSQLMSKNAANIAQNVALANAATTTTTNPNSRNSVVKTPGIIDKGTGALGLGALALLSPSIRKKVGGLFDDIGTPVNTAVNGVVDESAVGFADGISQNVSGAVTDAATSNIASSVIDDSVSNWGADWAGENIAGDVASSFAGDAATEFAADAALDVGVPYLTLITKGLPLVGDALGINELTDLGNFVQDGVNAVTDPILGAIDSITSSFGCFITTAICSAYGKPDDCDELTTMRNWRDTYGMTHFPEEVAEYYVIAPAIVEGVNRKPNAAQIWKSLRVKLIQILDDVKANDHLAAHVGYKELIQLAKEQAHG